MLTFAIANHYGNPHCPLSEETTMHRSLAATAALLLAAGVAANAATLTPAHAGPPATVESAATAATATQAAPELGRLMLVLDSSGSMAEQAGGGETKIQAAKTALNTVVDELPDDAEVGLRVFGAEVFEKTDPGACEDTQLVVEPGTDNRDDLRDAIDDYTPYGETPIPIALEKAAEDLGDEGARSIVLVSDGESTCGDPCDVAREISGRGINLQIDVVGLSVDSGARQQLECIAREGHGTYYDADSAEDIEVHVARVAERALRPFTLDGIPIEGGPVGSPTSLTAGDWTDKLGPVGSPTATRSFVFRRTTDDTTLRVAALTQGEEGDDGINVEILGPDGKTCNQGQVTRQFDARDILAAEAVATSAVDGCGAPGDYEITVSRMAGDATEIPFGLRVTEEPPVTDPGAPATDTTELTEPRVSGPETPVAGGASFANADEISDGKWSSTLVPGESLLYGFRLEFGQSARIAVDFPEGTAGMKEIVGSSPPDARLALFNPMQAALSYPNVGQVPIGPVVNEQRTLLTATSTVSRSALDVSPFVGNVNGIDDTSMAGDYYLGVSMEGADYNVEVPFTISIEIVGDPAEGPTYADGASWSVADGTTDDGAGDATDGATATAEPDDTTGTDAAGDSDDSGSGTTLALVAGVGGVGALLAALFLWRRRPEATPGGGDGS
jgi:Ca-activated chloride channel homolog